MVKDNKKCLICGKTYTYCPSCGEYDHLPKWMSIFHDENCMNIYFITVDYLAGTITKEEARKKYDACNLENRECFNNNVKRALSEAYEETKIASKNDVKNTGVSESNKKRTSRKEK